MDGKGRVLDNIFIERFWRIINYQYIYLNLVRLELIYSSGLISGLRNIILGPISNTKKKPTDIDENG